MNNFRVSVSKGVISIVAFDLIDGSRFVQNVYTK
jgi:hypothetical protein